jgi:hypothetical protein
VARCEHRFRENLVTDTNQNITSVQGTDSPSGPDMDIDGILDGGSPQKIKPYLVIDHNQMSNDIKRVVQRHFPVLDPEGSFFSPITISYRRARNLRNLLVNIRTEGNVGLESFDGQSPCGASRCLLCLQLPCVKSLSFESVNFGWTLRGSFNCNAKNCVYLAICRNCEIKYVGETYNFRSRMNGHSAQQDTLPASAFYKHKLDTGHSFRDFDLYLLRTNLLDKTDMWRWEAFFMYRLNTYWPMGLNFKEGSF